MRQLFILMATGWLVLFTAGAQAAENAHSAKHAQTKCPIRGGEIDKDVFVDYQGKRIYFCCPGCDKKFLANADALIKKMEADGVRIAAAPVLQKTCVVSGEPIDREVFVDHQDKRVYLCCKDCKSKFNKDPETYLKKLAEQEAAAKAATDKKAGMKDMEHMNHGDH